MEKETKKSPPKSKKIRFVKQPTWLGLAYSPGDVIDEKTLDKDLIEKLLKFEIVTRV